MTTEHQFKTLGGQPCHTHDLSNAEGLFLLGNPLRAGVVPAPAGAPTSCGLIHRNPAMPARGPAYAAGVAILLLVAPVCYAGDSTIPTPLFSDWLQNGVYLLGVIYVAVKLFGFFRPRPPYHQQFASASHTHPNLVHVDEQRACSEAHARERMTLRQEMGGMTGKLERQLDHVRNTITNQYDQLAARLEKLDERNDQRISHVYDALNPLAPRIAAVDATLSNHLADHRAKEGAHHAD